MLMPAPLAFLIGFVMGYLFLWILTYRNVQELKKSREAMVREMEKLKNDYITARNDHIMARNEYLEGRKPQRPQ